jgi:hypothetical protein
MSEPRTWTIYVKHGKVTTNSLMSSEAVPVIELSAYDIQAKRIAELEAYTKQLKLHIPTMSKEEAEYQAHNWRQAAHHAKEESCKFFADIQRLEKEKASLVAEVARLQDKVHEERRILNEQHTALMSIVTAENLKYRQEMDKINAGIPSEWAYSILQKERDTLKADVEFYKEMELRYNQLLEGTSAKRINELTAERDDFNYALKLANETIAERDNNLRQLYQERDALKTRVAELEAANENCISRSLHESRMKFRDTILQETLSYFIEWLEAGYGGMFGNQTTSPQESCYELIYEEKLPWLKEALAKAAQEGKSE